MKKERKLSPERIAEVRLLHATGQWPQSKLASKYRVTQSTISRIVAPPKAGRRDAGDLPPEALIVAPEGTPIGGTFIGPDGKPHIHVGIKPHGRGRLTQLQVKQIRELFATGEYSHPRLAKEFGVTRLTIYNIVHHKSWVGK